ncbi:MAG: hypothetical protein HC877_19470 [Thioploca sp.]|nr:hypothetical protein [Thioploca sp.]
MKQYKLLLILYLCCTGQVHASSFMCSIDIFGLCESSEKISGSINNAVNIIDEGIQRFDRGQRDWQGILKDVSRDLERVGEQTISKAVSGISEGIVLTGIETKCTVDFLRDRVKEDLIRLKGVLTGETPVLIPKLCVPNPSTIDFISVKNGQQKAIKIDGYNLDVNKIEVALVDNFGNESDISSSLTTPSPYLITLNLSDNRINLSQDSQKVVFKLSNETRKTISEISIIQPPKKELYVNLQLLTNSSREIAYFIPPKVGQGDSDFHKRVDIITKVELHISNDRNKIEARLYMRAYEGRHDWTKSEGYSNWEEVYRTEPGWELTRIFSPPFETFQYLDETCCHTDLHWGKNLVELWTILGDTDGSEAGTRTGVSVSFKQVQVELQRAF